jgi:hypothetical protein
MSRDVSVVLADVEGDKVAGVAERLHSSGAPVS